MCAMFKFTCKIDVRAEINGNEQIASVVFSI